MADDFFVMLKEPDEIRKNILEGSQGIINILELQKRIETLRGERSRNADLLRRNFQEIKQLLTHLESMLPAKEIPRQKIKTVKTSGIAAIERELNDIDSKMDALKKAHGKNK